MGKLLDSDKVLEILSTEYRRSSGLETELSNKIREQELEMKKDGITHRDYTSLMELSTLNKTILKETKAYSKGVHYARELVFELIEQTV